MSNTTRKHVWPVSLMMGIAIIGIVAMMVAFAASPGYTMAQGLPPPPPPPTDGGPAPDGAPPPPTPPPTPEAPNQAPMAIDGADMLSMEEGTTRSLGVDQLFEDPDEGDTVSITDAYVSSGSVTVQYRQERVTIVSGPRRGESMVTVMAEDEQGASASISITVTVEDDTSVTRPPVMPDAIESSSTTGGSDVKLTLRIGEPGALTAGSSVVLYLEDDYQVGDIDMSRVYFVGETTGRVYVTDAVVVDDDDHFGGDDDWDLRVYVPDMNPGNDTGFDNWSANDAKNIRLVLDKAGVKNPTEAGSHSVGYTVLAPGASVGEFDSEAHTQLDDLTTKAKITLNDEDAGRGKEITVTGSGFNNGTGAQVRVLVSNTDLTEGDQEANCRNIMLNGEKLGETEVGSDDKFTVTFTVHQDEFDAGAVNYICAADSEAGAPRLASEVKVFDLEPSVTVSPASANFGDEVTVKPRDFSAPIESITLGPTCAWTAASGNTDCFTPTRDGSDFVFDLPGGLDEQIQIAVTDGNDTKRIYMGVVPSSLALSQTEVAPNASIIISGSGFTENSSILVSNITIDDEPLVVVDAGTEGSGATRHVKVTSSGEFSATVRVWTDSSSSNNPTLDDGSYTIKVVDQGGFEGEVDVAILEPTLKVTPETASPRDFIVISGENWPISTADQDNSVTIEVDGRTRNADIGSTGRFRYEYQLRSTIKIGDEHDVTVTYEDGRDDIEEETTFNVAPAELSITPAAAGPGQTISVGIEGMPPYTLVDHVRIDGADRLGGRNVNTDREGDAVVSDILVPFLDPGFYPVEVKVGNETRVAQFEVLAEAAVTGAATELPGAVSSLGDNLEAIFHFNNTNKEWTFFDPRPEFADLNTLSELNGGQPYWVLVKDNQADVDWNGRLVNFTCAGGDCWNLEIW